MNGSFAISTRNYQLNYRHSKMTKSSIDILLPYWGDFSLLKKTVESVLAQSDDRWQLFVFDDCYPSDEAQKYFASLQHERVSYFRHEKNIGITNNFNYALKAATAEYCVLIGCDDIMLPNYVKAALENVGDADFYQPGVEVIDKDDKIYLPLVDRIKRTLQPKQSGPQGGEKLASSLCVGNWLYFPSITWKTATLQRYGFDPKYKIAEDLLLELSIIRDGGILSYDKTVTFQYRRFANSLSSREKSKGGVRFNEEAEVYAKFVDEFRAIGWKKASLSAKLRITSRLHEIVS
ncbi:MAG: glycosyltransferase [Pedobacter sp.]|nr:MAG: glycosyltransferase [Pedobacter sp.]